MKNNVKVLAVGLLVVLSAALAGDAFAGPRGKTVNHRQTAQKQRIKQGIKSGELTKRETARIKTGQTLINKYENKARSDGKITKKEFYTLQNMQNDQSKMIYNQKHDAQDRD